MRKVMPGNETIAHAAIAAGCRFFAGYPITPSSELAAAMSYLLPKVGGKFIQMEDEIASMAAAIGASITGEKSMTATSGPGFSLKQEHIGLACMMEVPVVIVNVMRGGPSTGLPTHPAQGDIMQARWGTHGDHPIIAIAPSLPREIYLETIRAFNLAEQYRNPVILLIDEILGHTYEVVDIPEPGEYDIINRKLPPKGLDRLDFYTYQRDEGDPPLLPNFFMGYNFHFESLAHDEMGFPTTDPEKVDRITRLREAKIEKNKEKIWKNHLLMVEDADTVIIAIGSVARSAIAAVEMARKEGIKLGLFRPITVWPFPDEPLREAITEKQRVIVAEMNLGQLKGEVEKALRREVEGLNKVNGVPISPKEILEKVKEGK